MREIFLVLVPTLTVVPAAVAAAFAMRKIAYTAIQGMTRQPEAAPQLFTAMIVAMALVEALVIYCLVVALIAASKI